MIAGCKRSMEWSIDIFVLWITTLWVSLTNKTVATWLFYPIGYLRPGKSFVPQLRPNKLQAKFQIWNVIAAIKFSPKM